MPSPVVAKFFAQSVLGKINFVSSEELFLMIHPVNYGLAWRMGLIFVQQNRMDI